jgi:hypothetical protein
MALPFQAPLRRGETWFFVGLASSFLNITESGSVTLSAPQLCSDDDTLMQQCRVFVAPGAHDDPRAAIQLLDDARGRVDASLRRDEQVLVFQYKGKFHATTHVRATDPSLTPYHSVGTDS